ncbi:hypothetical protein [Halodesulfovibrio aestuarii]|uniref:Uncharacterized protein n=1 Tax=Halodesulfovibrio aestuarii TaxID=126333 RepID=A0ABV4JTY1_9BACT
MEWLAAIGDLAGNFLSGGVLGSVFGFFGKFAELAKLKEQHRHAETMMDKEAKHLSMELSSKAQIAKTEANAQIEVAASHAMAASYDHDARRYLSGKALANNKVAAFFMCFVDFFRGITRPALTLWLSIASYLVYSQTVKILSITTQSTPLTPDQAYQLYWLCINQLLSLAGIAVGWWFSSRPSKITAGQ